MFHNQPFSNAFLARVRTTLTVVFVILTLISVIDEYYEFNKHTDEARNRYISKRKDRVRSVVTDLVQRIESQIHSVDQELKNHLNRESERIAALIDHICEPAGNTNLPPSRRKCRQDLGAFLKTLYQYEQSPCLLLLDSETARVVSCSGNPQWNGMFIQDVPDLHFRQIPDYAEHADSAGYFTMSWPAVTDTLPERTRVMQIRHLPAQGLSVIVGEFTDFEVNQLKSNLLNRISKIRYDGNNYVFVNSYDGMALVINSDRYRPGDNIWDVTDINGLYTTQMERGIVDSEDGEGFMEYTWVLPDTDVPAPKISFIKSIPEWGWMVGSGAYLDQLDEILAGVRSDFLRQLIRNILVYVAMYGIALFIAFKITGRFARGMNREFRVFERFYQQATSRRAKVDINALTLAEFQAMGKQLNVLSDEWWEMHESLAQTQERYQLAVKGSNDGIWDWDLQTDYIHFSTRWKLMLGYDEDEVGDRVEEWRGRIHPDDSEDTNAAVDQHIRGESVRLEHVHRMRCRDGSYIRVLMRGIVVHDAQGKPVRLVGFHTDVTQLYQIQEELNQANRQLLAEQQLFISGPVLVLKLSDYQNMAVEYVSTNVQDILGYIPDDLISGKVQLRDLLQRPAYHQLESVLKTAVANRDTHVELRPLNMSREDGSKLWAQFYFHLTYTPDENPGLHGYMLDVTTQYKAERALADEKERLRVTLQSIGDGVITTDIKGNVVLLNPVAEKLTGWSAEEASGHSLTDVFQLLDKTTRDPLEDPVDRVLQQGMAVGVQPNALLVSRDGSEHEIADSGAPIRDRNNRPIGIVLVFRDVTEENRLEEELIKARKLESVGILAGGIAHDFNNLLTAVMGNITLAKMDSEPASDQYARLQEAEKISLRTRDLTYQLLTFAKGGMPVKKLTNLGQLVRESATFSIRGSNVKLELEIPDGLPGAVVDAGQISQVINNLVINADQSMPAGGVMKVRVELRQLLNGEVPTLDAGSYLVVSVRDEGSGIQPDHLARIFEPYFTTKEMGSGLGLATSYSIVRKHEGQIQLDSTPGKGSCFRVYLPAFSEEAPVEIMENELQQLDLKVLLMDDEEGVRLVSGQMLKRMGCRVEFAENGLEAIELYDEAESTGDPYDLVILDLTIPGGMGGEETMHILRGKYPSVRGIVSSGYSNDPVMAHFRDFGFLAVMKKPFHITDLNQILTDVVNEA